MIIVVFMTINVFADSVSLGAINTGVVVSEVGVVSLVVGVVSSANIVVVLLEAGIVSLSTGVVSSALGMMLVELGGISSGVGDLVGSFVLLAVVTIRTQSSELKKEEMTAIIMLYI